MSRDRENEYLTIRQAAKYLSISEPVLRLTIRCGKIPAQRLSGRRGTLVRKSDLRPFLDPLSEGTREDAFSNAAPPSSGQGASGEAATGEAAGKARKAGRGRGTARRAASRDEHSGKREDVA